MRVSVAAVLALLLPCSLHAEDLSSATPIAGNWSYSATSGGSEAIFSNASGSPQLWVRCIRATRRISIIRAATAAAPAINIWTSSQSRNVPASFNPATGRLTVDLPNFDPLLDAIASSRGRVAFAVGTQPALVVPPWAEPARVFEDCRA